MAYHPNFPVNLDIKPSKDLSLAADSEDSEFGVAAQQDAIEKFGIAGRVWEASYLLNVYIQNPPDLLFDPPFLAHNNLSRMPIILELGSGTGIVASMLVKQFTKQEVTLAATDLPEVCPLLAKNLHRYIAGNGRPTVLVRPLTWGNESEARSVATELAQVSSNQEVLALPHLTHVICSDLVYFPELLAPLLRTLIQVTSPSFSSSAYMYQSPSVIISYKIRSLAKETNFWSAFGLWFLFRPVLVREYRVPERAPGPTNERPRPIHVQPRSQTLDAPWRRFGSADDGDLFIFVASRRPESYTWDIPRSDDELLGGVGTWGTPAQKSDDTFESLLMMRMDANE